MRTLTLIISAVLITLIATKVSAQQPEGQRKVSCKIVTGYGTAIGFGSTKLEAKENARLKCGTSMIDQYFASRREVPEDVKDDLALACVNLECS